MDHVYVARVTPNRRIQDGVATGQKHKKLYYEQDACTGVHCLPTRRKWAQSGYLCTTPSTAQAGADAGKSGGGGGVIQIWDLIST